LQFQLLPAILRQRQIQLRMLLQDMHRVDIFDAGTPQLAAAVPFYGPAPETPTFDGAKAACCTLLLDQAPSPGLLAALRRNESVIHLLLEAN